MLVLLGFRACGFGCTGNSKLGSVGVAHSSFAATCWRKGFNKDASMYGTMHDFVLVLQCHSSVLTLAFAGFMC